MADRGREYLILADEDLISLVEAGDAEAFATLYDRHSRAAFSLAYRMMGERQASEDLTQDAFLKVWRGASSYRSERGSVRTWILSIVHNRGIDQLRSQASRRRTQDRVEATAPRSQPSEAFGERQRADVDPLNSPQPRHRPAPLPSEPAQDPGQGRSHCPTLPTERGLRREAACGRGSSQ